MIHNCKCDICDIVKKEIPEALKYISFNENDYVARERLVVNWKNVISDRANCDYICGEMQDFMRDAIEKGTLKHAPKI
ncbi:hypothetical protein LJB90_01845 [Eubacteriales bacterium OttesenSCG-928-G02]|nr:hypothetical protein [Eubacteriales bacterium OttesenSCG-928-G02]